MLLLPNHLPRDKVVFMGTESTVTGQIIDVGEVVEPLAPSR